MLGFLETGRPTLVRDPGGQDLISRGRIWVEPATGAVWRVEWIYKADERFVTAGPQSSLTVDFAPSEQLGMLVPQEMREVFFAADGLEAPGRRRGHLPELQALRHERADRAPIIMKALALALIAVAAVSQDPTADQVRDRLDSYLLKYEPELSSLVADEFMVQRDAPSRNAYVTAAPRIFNRRLISEVAFISLPGGLGWLGFRRAINMNGKDLPEAGPSLGVLLTDDDKDDLSQAQLLLTESARLNLGMPRTTNLPNLPLEFLHPRNRRRFSHRIDGTEKIRGLETTRMVITETSSPTMIQRPEGGDMTSLILAWVETATGRLIRAQVKTRDARLGMPQFDAVIWVDFKQDEKLGLLVPVEMKEDFFAGQFREGTSVAKYSKYRKFQTTGRIVPPPGQ